MGVPSACGCNQNSEPRTHGRFRATLQVAGGADMVGTLCVVPMRGSTGSMVVPDEDAPLTGRPSKTSMRWSPPQGCTQAVTEWSARASRCGSSRRPSTHRRAPRRRRRSRRPSTPYLLCSLLHMYLAMYWNTFPEGECGDLRQVKGPVDEVGAIFREAGISFDHVPFRIIVLVASRV